MSRALNVARSSPTFGWFVSELDVDHAGVAEPAGKQCDPVGARELIRS